MNLQNLFEMQKDLDSFIQETRKIDENVFRKKGLALLVELAELANETRCFKFWSTKGMSERSIILEEYVDSIHFLLSLGLEKGFEDLEEWPEPVAENDLTELFLGTFSAVQQFIAEPELENYKNAWSWYGGIAHAMDFSYGDVLEAYIEKNQTNYDRQNKGY
ncbi:dimeric dUTPase (all-alpha-NTP-PPase superfamily) [Planomicrobium soli]|uniref:Dimeric dUTPase (All-alpha-NTP-PPase superfamily) n=1 Tax=Planomicrobium soli TaxID=1176648 RepID=A0A2P8GML9_9BACL|nr:dUTP diphosphatase [Planomicrobium soli]PSL35213.1 dimeric dUTPase (all-alpha-NTP-PPase superfamily) [Planomicrobium soli]